MTVLAAILAAELVAVATMADRVPEKSVHPVEEWGRCAAEKNADDVAWMDKMASRKTDIQGRALDGALMYGLIAMWRDCLPTNTGMDNKLGTAFIDQAVREWKRDRSRHSIKRRADDWADCLAEEVPAKAKAFLFAREMESTGAKVLVENVDPQKALFEPLAACDALRPAELTGRDTLDVHARLNYRLRLNAKTQAGLKRGRGVATDSVAAMAFARHPLAAMPLAPTKIAG